MTRRPALAGRRRPHPRLGQHFLADSRIAGRILEELVCHADDAWLEIGAGHGEMTVGLAATGATVVAVERDPKLAAALRARLAGFPRARVVEGDILATRLDTLARESRVARWRVYGNLPYYITSPILQRLFAALELIRDIHVVMQREVAERVAARPGTRAYGYLSVLAQFYTRPEILMPIPRGAFRPPPKVESALVWLAPPGARAALGVEDAGAFLRFVGACFRQKRKTLLNNLRGLHGAERVAAALATAGFGSRARARAEELSLDQFARLFRLL